MKMEAKNWKLWFLSAMTICLSSSFWSPVEAVTDGRDMQVLNNLKQIWGGATSSWTNNTDPCVSWPYVTCNLTRVTSLNLPDKNLQGYIPADIGLLSSLQTLDLSFNSGLGKTIPTELGSLSNLQYLSLQSCNFEGSIPSSLGNISSLLYLALNNNQLTGGIPSSLGALSNLYWLDVAYNNLNGSLPVSSLSPDRLGLDTLPNIQHFHLSNNSFSGAIPPELGGAKNCIHLLLDFNSFTGSIPDTFGNLSNLQILSLHYNQLSGAIPSTLNNIVKGPGNSTSPPFYSGLHQLRVNHNLLTGVVPNLTLDQLEYVNFGDNPFASQPFPTWLSPANPLQSIWFENASLTGELPVDVLNNTYLESMYLSNNMLSGFLTLPARSDLASDLTILLQNNQITNVDSKNISGSPKYHIMLEGNPICMPSSLVTAPSLCGTQTSSTSAPTSWTSSLYTLNGCGSPCSDGLDLNAQTCSCSVPLVVALELRSPTFSNIDDNTLWERLKIQTFDSLSNNLAVPIVNDSVWVVRATFTPSGRVDVELKIFPASGDRFNQNATDFIMQEYTLQRMKYDSPFKPYRVLSFGPPAGQRNSGTTNAIIIGVAVGAFVILVLIGVLIFIAITQKRRADKALQSRPFASWGVGGAASGEAPQLKGARWFSFEEIRKLTNSFHEDNEIGAGGYGRVYKGVIPGTGQKIAVKRAQEDSLQGAQEFKNEIELLSRVHHRNLVGLVGFCYENGEQMLVYEYMSGGTLTQLLRGTKLKRALNWDERVHIAVDSARGLAYLHENASPPIIHRDVKACNILLDDKLLAKVADFGLSQLAPENGDKLDTQIKGTMGYLDPEYYMTSELSFKSDVYSFGVVLLEILTEMPPIQHGSHIVRMVRTTYEKSGMQGIMEMLDPILSDTPVQDVEKFLNLALSCVEEIGAERPTMKEVEQQLDTLVGPKVYAFGGIESRSVSKKLKSQPPRSGDLERGGMNSESSSTQFNYTGSFAPKPVEPK